MCGRLDGLVHPRRDHAFRRVSVKARVLARLPSSKTSCLLNDAAKMLTGICVSTSVVMYNPEMALSLSVRVPPRLECLGTVSEAGVLARLQEHRRRGRDRAILRDAVQRAVDDELRWRHVVLMLIFTDSSLILQLQSSAEKRPSIGTYLLTRCVDSDELRWCQVECVARLPPRHSSHPHL